MYHQTIGPTGPIFLTKYLREGKKMYGNEPVDKRVYGVIILLLVLYYGALMIGTKDRIEWLRSLSPTEYVFRP